MLLLIIIENPCFLESKEQQIELLLVIKMCIALKVSIFLFSSDVLYEHWRIQIPFSLIIFLP